MATYASSNLLTLFNRYAGRPSGDSISDADKYSRLAQAQQTVRADLAARVPEPYYSHAAYGSTPTLTTTDNQVFTFGTDANGDPSFPVGKVNIYPSVNAIPDYPWQEGIDYLWEGNQIRIPNNRTYVGTLYWRGIAPMEEISSTVQPTLTPPPMRILIVIEAVRAFAQEGRRNTELADRMAAEYGVQLARWCLTLKTGQFTRSPRQSISGLKAAMMGTY